MPAPDADWTIVDASPLSKRYLNRQVLLDEATARDGTPCFNTYFHMAGRRVVSAIAFFDMREFEVLRVRVPAA